jgi:hypothetical protein
VLKASLACLKKGFFEEREKKVFIEFYTCCRVGLFFAFKFGSKLMNTLLHSKDLRFNSLLLHADKMR